MNLLQGPEAQWDLWSTRVFLSVVGDDADLVAARTVIERCFAGLIDASSQLGAGLDWKTSLQEAAATLGMGVPQYLIDESGPDHQKEFHARVRLVEDVLGEGWGGSKKVAEQQAAAQAFAAIEARLDTAES